MRYLTHCLACQSNTLMTRLRVNHIQRAWFSWWCKHSKLWFDSPPHLFTAVVLWRTRTAVWDLLDHLRNNAWNRFPLLIINIKMQQVVREEEEENDDDDIFGGTCRSFTIQLPWQQCKIPAWRSIPFLVIWGKSLISREPSPEPLCFLYQNTVELWGLSSTDANEKPRVCALLSRSGLVPKRTTMHSKYNIKRGPVYIPVNLVF